MELFHGTTEDNAKILLGPPNNVDVAKGRGELGKGFYLGNNISLAASLSKSRGQKNSAILKFIINEAEYVNLNIHVINRRQVVINKWKNLIKLKATDQHKFNFDVVVAPFATIDFAHQYKFESLRSQLFLNKTYFYKL